MTGVLVLPAMSTDWMVSVYVPASAPAAAIAPTPPRSPPQVKKSCRASRSASRCCRRRSSDCNDGRAAERRAHAAAGRRAPRGGAAARAGSVSASGTCGAATPNAAVTDCAALGATTHVPVPMQPPDHPENVLPAAGVAVGDSMVPPGTGAAQALPPVEHVRVVEPTLTVPTPSPAISSCTWWLTATGGGSVAVGSPGSQAVRVTAGRATAAKTPAPRCRCAHRGGHHPLASRDRLADHVGRRRSGSDRGDTYRGTSSPPHSRPAPPSVAR